MHLNEVLKSIQVLKSHKNSTFCNESCIAQQQKQCLLAKDKCSLFSLSYCSYRRFFCGDDLLLCFQILRIAQKDASFFCMRKDKRTKSQLKHLGHMYIYFHIYVCKTQKKVKKYFERSNTSQNVVILQGVYYTLHINLYHNTFGQLIFFDIFRKCKVV